VTGLLGYRRVLIVTAVEPERAAVLAGLRAAGPADRRAGAWSDAPADNDSRSVGLIKEDSGSSAPQRPRSLPDQREDSGVDVAVVGVGPAVAAANTARLLADAEHRGRPYDAVICAGIAGGFSGRVEVAGLAVATESIAADLGADSPDGFIGLDELGFGTARRPADLGPSLQKALADAVGGPILSVSTVTGTAAGTRALTERHPEAVAEGMEGFGVACAAGDKPFGEVRAISNVVGPRNREAWRIAPALAALETAFHRLAGVTLER
jgi:futalosine hydrolase